MHKPLLALLAVLAVLLAACGGAPPQQAATQAPAGDAATEEGGDAAMEEGGDAAMEDEGDNAATEEGDNAAMEEGGDGAMEEGGDGVTEEEGSDAAVPAPTNDDDCAAPGVLCIGLVTDVGEIDDKSFNQSSWDGVLRAQEEFGAVVNYVETTDPNDYANNIALFVEKDYDIVVTVGFALGQATLEMAEEYPNTHFIGVDQFQVEPVDNIAGLIFNEDQAGFLAGALAAQVSDTGTIAAVLGTDLVPPVVAFNEGYANGATYINPDISVISTYHPGGLDVAFTDPEWGATTAQQAVDQGADVVFAAGGKTGNGALIQTASNDGVYCIGVDTDQWLTVPEAHPCLISSAVKNITQGVYDLVSMHVEESFPAGNYVGNVGLAPFHDFESDVPQEVKDQLDEIKQGLEDGSIETGYSPE